MITNFLSDFVSEQRRNKIEEILAQRTHYLTVILEDIYQSQNASAVLRTCECFGIQNLNIIENYNPYNINPMVVKGSDKWLSIRKFNNAQSNSVEAIKQLKSEGYRIVATTLNQKSIGLYDFDLHQGKCAVVFGNEHQGVSEQILKEADEYLQIPMHGFTQSLNISVSAGIVLSYLTQKLKHSSVNWQLNEDEKKTLREQWFRNSVKNSEMLVKRFLEEK